MSDVERSTGAGIKKSKIAIDKAKSLQTCLNIIKDPIYIFLRRSQESLLCKVLEHIVFKSIHVINHAEKYDILAHYQHGFRKGHSRETQLINTVEEISRGLNSKQQLDCLVLDFSKAFDTVPHQRLLYKLEYYGITGTTLKWIRSWLTTRTQTLVVDGEALSEVHVAFGVPQCTVLGLLLFLLYINDIGEGVNSSIKLFADDCILFRQIRGKEDADGLQHDLDTVVEWSHRWLMSFNPKKCSVLKITQSKQPPFHQYLMCREEITHVDQQTYLGLEITKDLSWGPHIQKVVTKANRNLNMIRRNLGQC